MELDGLGRWQHNDNGQSVLVSGKWVQVQSDDPSGWVPGPGRWMHDSGQPVWIPGPGKYVHNDDGTSIWVPTLNTWEYSYNKLYTWICGQIIMLSRLSGIRN